MHEVAALDVAVEARHLLEQRERALAQLVALPGLLAVREETDRGLVHRQAGARIRAPCANWASHSGVQSTVDPPSMSSWWRVPAGTGIGTAMAGREITRTRPMRSNAPPSSHPCSRHRPSPGRPSRTAWAERTSDESFLPRRRGRVLVHGHDIAGVLDVDARDTAVGKQRRDRVLLPDEQHVDAELGDRVERAADDLVRGFVAAHGVDRDGDALGAHVR